MSENHARSLLRQLLALAYEAGYDRGQHDIEPNGVESPPDFDEWFDSNNA